MVVGNLSLAPNMALAATTVNPASGGTGISVDTFGGTFKALNGPSFNAENGDIEIGTHTITLPDGWEFDTDSTITISAFNDIVIADTTVQPTANSFSFEITSESTSAGSIGFSGLKVRPIVTDLSNEGNMTYSGAGIIGVTPGGGGTNFGSLSTVAGTVAKLVFSTQPSVSTVYGSAFSAQPVVKTQDQFGNDSSNGASGKTVNLSLAAGSGSLVGTFSQDVSSGTATFSGLKVDTVGMKQLLASSDGLASATGDEFEITPKTLTATVTVDNKTYDGTTDATIADVVLDNLESDDDVTITGNGTATFSDPNADTGISVTSNDVAINGADVGNYTFDNTANGTANIDPMLVTITPTASQTKVYGNSDPILVYSNSDLIGGDAVSGVLNRAAGEDVGNYAYTLGNLSAGSNYSLSLAGGIDTFSITERDITVVAVGVNKEYDGEIDATVALSSADEVIGDGLVYAYASALFNDKTANTGKLVSVGGIGISGAKSDNYNLLNTTTTTTADITKKTLTATININNRVYDGTTIATYCSDPCVPRVLIGTIEGDGVVIVNTGTKSFPDEHIGTNKVVTATGLTLGGTDRDNYNFDGIGIGSANINKRPITVTSMADTKIYDGDTSSNGVPDVTSPNSPPIVDGDLAGFVQAFDNKNIGSGKTLTPSGLVNDGNSGLNYDVTFVPVSTGEITVKNINVTAQSDTKVYDGNVASSVAPVVDTLATGDSVGTAPIQVFDDKDVATGKTLAPSGLAINDGNGGANYNVTYVTNITGVITQKGLTVSGATTVSRVYDGNTSATVDFSTANLVGAVAGEESDIVNLNSIGYSAVFNNKNVGTGKTATISGLTLTGTGKDNYSLTQPILNDGAITKKTLTVIATGNNKTYDATDVASVNLSTDKIEGDDLTLTHQAIFSDGKNVGTGKSINVTNIAISGGIDQGNYSLGNTTTSATADVTQAPLMATVTVNNKVVDGNNTATITGVTLNGVLLTDVVTVTDQGMATFAEVTVGTHSVTSTGVILAGADKDNYEFSGTATGSGEILPVPTVVYVDDDWAAVPMWTDPDEEGLATYLGYDAFATIQDGIDAVDDGGTVNVSAGTYAESITVNKTVAIEGVGDETIVSPAIDGNGFLINTDDVIIRNLKIILHTSGVDAQAIRLEGASLVTLSGNTIETSGDKGIGIWIGGIGYSNSNNLTISNNIITIANESTGIYAERGTPAQTGWNISSNTITANLGNPLELYDVASSTVDGNTLTTSSLGGSNVMWFAELSDLSDLVFSNNVVDGSLGSEVAIGTGFQTTSTHSISTVTILGNTFSNWGSRALRVGFVSGIGTTDDVSVSGNKFLSVGETLKNYDMAQVNAENNWWGTINGSTIASNVVGNVDYRPWCSDENCSPLDDASPTVAITSSESSPTNSSSVEILINFSEDISGFTVEDIAVSGATKGSLSGTGDSYSISLTSPSDGAITVDIDADAAWDLSGNYNTAATQLSIVYDGTVPTGSVSIVSDNSINTLAKVEDTVTVTLVSNEDIQTPVVTIAGHTTTVEQDGDAQHWDATYVMDSVDTEGVVPFTINFSDLAGNNGVEVTQSTGGVTGSVTFDKTAPIISVYSPDADARVNTVAVIEFTNDSDLTPTVAECSVDNSHWHACTTAVATLGDLAEFAGLGQSTFTLYLRGIDTAGNIGTTQVALVKDTSVPSVQSHVPTYNAVSIDPSVNIVITFDEAVVAENSNVSFSPAFTDFTIENSGTATITINPNNPTSDNTTYIITLSGVTDLAGNEMADYDDIKFTTATNYDIALSANATGWNLISLPVVPTESSIVDVLGDAASSIDIVWTYDPSNPNASDTNGWLSYSPTDPEGTNNLDIMTAGYGYWISVSRNAIISGSGTLLPVGPDSPPERDLRAGWNLIGYYQNPGEDTSISSDAFASLGTLSSLWSYDNVSGGYKTVTTILPGDGFWVALPTEKTYYPGNISN